MRRLATALLIFPFLSSCEKWPPYEKELRQNFAENRVAMETLGAKIADTKYRRVSQTGIIGIHRLDDSFNVVAEYGGDEFIAPDLIEDDPKWEQNFKQANLFSVSIYEGKTTYGLGGELPDKKRSIWVEYAHNTDRKSDLKSCLPEHNDLLCGQCGVILDDEWFLEYWWKPRVMLPDLYDDMIDGQLSVDEYGQKADNALQECLATDLEAIGYELSEW